MAVFALDMRQYSVTSSDTLHHFRDVSDTLTYVAGTHPVYYPRFDVVMSDDVRIVALSLPAVTLETRVDWMYYMASSPAGASEIARIDDMRRHVVFEDEVYRLRDTHMGIRYSSQQAQAQECTVSYYTLCSGDDECEDVACECRVLILERSESGCEVLLATPVEIADLALVERR